ncbi:MAG: peptidylprolyl isomerase [Glaciihabitans sp.]|nr:peptidylprolyl isomerase [Glaciihabitans sp.]
MAVRVQINASDWDLFLFPTGRRVVRKTAALVLAVGLMASLAACSTSGNEEVAAEDCTPTASGSVSDALDITGAFGEAPEETLTDVPLTVTASERTVISKGDGAVAASGDTLTIDYTIYNGETGAQIETTTYDGEGLAQLTVGSGLPVLDDTLLCSTEGSRVVGIGTAEGLTDEGLAAFDLTAESSIVVVADVVTVEATPEAVVVEQEFPKATGEAQALPDGFPAIGVSVADDEAGTPTVTIPDGDAPTELQVATLIKGTGDVVGPAADVLVNYQGIVWGSKTVFNDSWASGAPVQFNTGGVVQGFTAAIEGQTVGSQVLVTVPPAAGYGDAGQPSAGISGTDTLVFIIDIVGEGPADE